MVVKIIVVRSTTPRIIEEDMYTLADSTLEKPRLVNPAVHGILKLVDPFIRSVKTKTKSRHLFLKQRPICGFVIKFYNSGHVVLEFHNILVQVRFATSKTKHDT